MSNFFKTFQAENISNVSINDLLKVAFNMNREKSNHGSICFAPTVNMLFATDGTVRACCHNNENILGRYPEQTISQIWNSQEANHFRLKMSEYKFLSGCHGCESDYKTQQFDEMPARHFDNLPRNFFYPTMMEFLWSNTCNLECVMCSGELSSSIRKNRDNLSPINSPYDKEFVNQLMEFIPHLHEVRFSGAGEAFLIDLNFDFWETLIIKNPNCKIVVQTNGTVLNSKVKDFLKRGNFQIGVSLDSLKKETYESIRLNASFENVMKNIHYFSLYNKGNKKPFIISTCVMRQNWKELPSFVNFCNSIGAYATFHKVRSPLSYALYNLQSSELSNIYNELTQVEFPTNSVIERKNNNHYKYFISVIKEWANNAKDYREEKYEWINLSTIELKNHIKMKVSDYILQQPINEIDKQQHIDVCEKKFDEVLKFWNDEIQLRKLLLHLCVVPVNEITPSLLNNTVEKIYEMSILSMNS